MGSLGKPPLFEGKDYVYWKARITVFLQSLGSEIWDICMSETYVVLNGHLTQAQVAQHEANSKAMNALYSSLSREEFGWISELPTARQI